MQEFVVGSTSKSVNVFIQDSSSTTGAGLSGLVFNTSNLAAYYSFTGASATATVLTLATLATVTTAYSSGGFIEIDATHMKGWYRLDLPTAVLAASSGPEVSIHLYGATNMAPCPIKLKLTGWNNQDGVHGGMSALPNTACTTNASLLTSGSGTDQLSVASGKVLLQATQSGVTIPTVTTVTNQLTAAAIATGVWQDATAGDFTTASSIGKCLYIANVVPGGTGGHFIAGTNAATTITTSLTTHLVGTVDTVTTVTNQLTAAQIATGVWQDATAGDFTTASSIGKALYVSNVVPGGAGGHFIAGTNAATTITTGLTTTFTGNLTGSVGSVTGAVGSVTGAVGSVTGAVGSVTGNVGGNVTGSVGSISGITFPTHFASLGIDASGNVTVGGYATNEDPATLVLGATASSWDSAGTIGAAINAAGGSGDPWATALPGAYSAGTAGYIIGTNIDAAVSSRMATFSLPTNFAALGITAGGKISEVVLVDTLTTYTGDTPQTGDSYARIGAAGAGLTALGDTRIAHLDANVSSRSAPATAQTIDGTSPLTESYSTGAMTLAQGIYEIAQVVGQNSVASTTITVQKRDKTTTAATFTTDDAVSPTSRTRAT